MPRGGDAIVPAAMRIFASIALLPWLAGCGLFLPGDEADAGDEVGAESEDVFVAVGDQGALLSSPDGLAWTTRTSGLGTTLNDVAFGIDDAGENTFVVVGQAGKILFSHNGLDWLSGSSPSSRDLHSVVFHVDRFVAVGGDYSAGAETLESQDGSTWTRPEYPAPPHLLTGLATNGVTLVSIGTRQSDQQIFGLFTWAEGLGWQQRIDGAVNGARYDAVAAGIPAFALIGAGTAATSNDTITWQPTTVVASPPMHGLHYTAFGWIAVGDGAGILTSADAFLWTSHLSPLTASLRAVTTSGSLHVAVGDAGAIVTSIDGANWVAATSPLAVNLRSVVHPRE